MSDDRRHNAEPSDTRSTAELISAYLDDRESLSAEDLEQIETLLAADPSVRQIQSELTVIRRGLRDLEPLAAPREYHLTAEMTGAPEPIALDAHRAQPATGMARHTAAMRWATAAAAVLFVFVLGADLILNNVFTDSGVTDRSLSYEESGVMSRESSDDADAAGDTSAQPESIEGSGEAAGGAADDESEPPVADSSEAAAGGVADDGADAAEAKEEESSPAVTASMPEESADAANDADDALPGPEAEALVQQTEEATAQNDLFATNTARAVEGDTSNDRRLWRIVEFALVIVLGALLTALVILSRLGRERS